MSEQVNPFYPVLRNQLFTQFNDGDMIQDVDTERDALVNGVNGGMLGVVGRVYKLVENQEVDRVFREAFDGLPIEEVRDHLNYKENRWQRDFILNGDDFNIYIGDDVVQTKISIWNGYDGKSSVGFSISAYRRHNNLTLLSKMFGKTYSHISDGLVDRIREDFDDQITKFQHINSLFLQWSRESMSRDTFESFVRGQVRNDEVGNTGYISEKQADAIIDSYESHLLRS